MPASTSKRRRVIQEDEVADQSSQGSLQPASQSTQRPRDLPPDLKFPFTSNPAAERQFKAIQNDTTANINLHGTDVLEALKAAAIDLEQYCPDSNEALAKKLDTGFRSTLDTIQSLEARSTAISGLHAKATGLTDITAAYVNDARTLELNYNSKTTRQKYNDRPYTDFKDKIHRVHHRNEAPPPITLYIPREQGDDESDDEVTMAAGKSDKEFKCPLSQTWLQEPVSSTICSHSYSKRAIMAYVTQNGGRVACPVQGCVAMLTKQTLRDNPALARMVAESQQGNGDSEDSDEENIVEIE